MNNEYFAVQYLPPSKVMQGLSEPGLIEGSNNHIRVYDTYQKARDAAISCPFTQELMSGAACADGQYIMTPSVSFIYTINVDADKAYNIEDNGAAFTLDDVSEIAVAVGADVIQDAQVIGKREEDSFLPKRDEKLFYYNLAPAMLTDRINRLTRLCETMERSDHGDEVSLTDPETILCIKEAFAPGVFVERYAEWYSEMSVADRLLVQAERAIVVNGDISTIAMLKAFHALYDKQMQIYSHPVTALYATASIAQKWMEPDQKFVMQGIRDNNNITKYWEMAQAGINPQWTEHPDYSFDEPEEVIE